jgi:hypothetical protein
MLTILLGLSGCATDIPEDSYILQDSASAMAVQVQVRPKATDTTAYPTSCPSNDAQCLFCAQSARISKSANGPQAAVVWEKCDGSKLNSDHSCEVLVGSKNGSSRTSVTWSAGSSQLTTTFSIWPSAQDWRQDPVGTEKLFVLVCDEPNAAYNYWYAYDGDTVTFEKTL